MSSADEPTSGGGGGGRKCRRLGLDDFNYTFVGYEPPPAAKTNDGREENKGEGANAEDSGVTSPAEAAEAASSSADDGRRASLASAAGGGGGGGGAAAGEAGGDEEAPYVYNLPRKYRRRRGDDDDVYGDGGGSHGGPPVDPTAAISSGLGILCCCFTVCFIIAGGVLISHYNAYDKPAQQQDGGGGDNRHQFAAYVCFVLAGAAFLCGCCSLCVGCLAAIEGGGAMGGGGGGHESGGGGGDPKEVRVRLRRLNGQVESGEDALEWARLDVTGDVEDVKKARKKEAKERKEKEKKERDELEERVKKDLEAGKSLKEIRQTYRPICFYFAFDGDTSVSNIELLRKQVSLIVHQGRKGVDQAVIVVTSPGGEVSSYGLAASQLVRIRKAGIRLVVCVDSVAASGGYMMASVADTICAAPFAIVGSIGVLAQVPNFHRFLDKHDVDAYTFTAGRYKRTVDPIAEVTEEGKAKFREELEEIHGAFKDHVALARPRLGREGDIEDVATGEAWLAVQAKERGLVDVIMTSDEYLDSAREGGYDVIELLQRKHRRAWYGALGDVQGAAASGVRGIVDGLRSAAAAETAARPSFRPMAIS